jgi:hypothetical protein
VVGIADGLEYLAWIASRRGQHLRAALLFGAAANERSIAGIRLAVSDCDTHDRYVAAGHTAVGVDAFDAAHSTGGAMPLDAAVAIALEG